MSNQGTTQPDTKVDTKVDTSSTDLSRKMWQRINPGYTSVPDHFKSVSQGAFTTFDDDEKDVTDKAHFRRRDEFTSYNEARIRGGFEKQRAAPAPKKK